MQMNQPRLKAQLRKLGNRAEPFTKHGQGDPVRVLGIKSGQRLNSPIKPWHNAQALSAVAGELGQKRPAH